MRLTITLQRFNPEHDATPHDEEVRLDVRRDDPYGAYPELEFKVITSDRCDILGRVIVRVGETTLTIATVNNGEAGVRLDLGRLHVRRGGVLDGAVAGEKGPVLRPPVVEPQPVLLHHLGPNALHPAGSRPTSSPGSPASMHWRWS